MQFKLETGGAAAGAQAAGQGLGNIFKAYVMGPQTRQQAEQDTIAKASDIYYRRMAGDKYGAEALKLGQEAEGLRKTNAARSAPIDASLPDYEQRTMRAFQATGDTNLENYAKALSLLQRVGITDQAVANVDNLDTMNRLNTLTKEGATYTPFKDVGTTGYSINQATGVQVQANPVLAKLFGDKTGSEIAENRAQAGSASASGANSRASAELTAAKLKHFVETGRMPGTGDESSGGLNIGQIRDDIRADFNAIYPVNATRARPKGTPSFEDFTRQWLRQYNIPEAEFFGTARTAAVSGSNPPVAPAEVDDAGLDVALNKAVNAIKRGAPAASARQRFESNGITEARLLAHARAAIGRGEDPAVVKERLRTLGISPKGL